MGYPSDVSDAEWSEMEGFFQPEHPGRPRKYTMRSISQAHHPFQGFSCL